MVAPSVYVVGVVTLLNGRAQADCYSRNGVASQDSRWNPGPELVPCGRNSNTCCFTGQKCGSNLLCSVGAALHREWCDNKEWRGCSGIGPEVLEFGITLIECSSNIVCYSGPDCCTNGGPIFFIEPTNGNVQNAKTTAINTSLPIWWDANASKTRSLSVSSAPTAAQSPNSSAQPGTVPTGSSSSLSAGAGAGIGIGCAVAAIGLGALVWMLLRRRRRPASDKRSKEEQELKTHDDKAATQARVHQHHSEEPRRQELDPQLGRIQEMPS